MLWRTASLDKAEYPVWLKANVIKVLKNIQSLKKSLKMSA